MRRPTTARALFAWHDAALRIREARLALGYSVWIGQEELKWPQHHGEPQCGWYRRRFVKGGPWVPAIVWLHQVIDAGTGELLEPEVLRCRVGTEARDPAREWPQLWPNPVTEVEYLRLLDLHLSDPVYRATHAAVDLTLTAGDPA